MRTVLITGASGFIGRQCLPILAANGYAVQAVSRFPIPEVELPGVTWNEGSLLEPGFTTRLINRLQPDYLLHLAWYPASPGKFWSAPDNLRWVTTSLELFDAFRERGGKRLVAAGSCAEYGLIEGECDEDKAQLLPTTLYGVSKHCVGNVLHAWSQQTHLSSAWARIFQLYGPAENPARVIPYVVRSLLRNQPAGCSQGTQIVDFLYAEDAASALIALLDSDVQGPVNVGSGKPLPLRTILEEVGTQTGRPHLIRFGERDSVHHVGGIWANTTKLIENTPWKQRYALTEGIAKTIAWWKRDLGLDHGV